MIAKLDFYLELCYDVILRSKIKYFFYKEEG